MRRPTRDDVCDALALVRCAHEGDGQGANAILDNGDAAWIAAFLAAIVRDLIGDIAALTDESRDALTWELVARHKAAHGIGA